MTQPHDAGQPDLFAWAPDSAEQLLAIQQLPPAGLPAPFTSTRVEQVLAFIHRLDTSALEDQQIALTIVRQLEVLHQEVAAEMRADPNASPVQVAGWAVDADRLQQCRILLDSISLD